MTEPPDFISLVEVLLGACIMAGAIGCGLRIRWDVLTDLRVRWRISIVFMSFFLAGYVAFLILLFLKVHVSLTLLTASVFLGGACFVLLVVMLVRVINQRVEQYVTDLEERNKTLGQEITARQQAQQQLCEEQGRLDHLTHHDLLTGLPNRVLFDDRLEQSLKLARRQNQTVAVLCLGLDRFKRINDSVGRAIGDQILQGLATRLQDTMRESDTIARLGGDEFSIILSQVRHVEDAGSTARKIIEAINDPFSLAGQQIYVNASVGIALYPHDGEETHILIKNADTALHRAKERGTNIYQLYSPAMNARALERLALENGLRGAAERGELVLYYQPLVDLQSRRMVGMEALLRWRHPDRGLVPPMDFIPLAEDSGIIMSIGEWVLDNACRQLKKWQDLGLPQLSMAINVSPRQFLKKDLARFVGRTLAETGVDPGHLEFEVTEGTIMLDANRAIQTLSEFHGLGIRISIDDFGTGYSSLSYIKKFPIHTLKIDRSFVIDLCEDSDDAAIVKAIIAMAHSLKLKVVAEGVETREQLIFLRALGCDCAQGYLFSRPLPAEEVISFVSTEISSTRNWTDDPVTSP